MFKGAGAFHSAGQSKEGSGHLGPILGPSGPFWTILDKNDFLPQMDKVGVGRGASEQNINSCLKRSKRVQMGPKGFLMVKNT